MLFLTENQGGSILRCFLYPHSCFDSDFPYQTLPRLWLSYVSHGYSQAHYKHQLTFIAYELLLQAISVFWVSKHHLLKRLSNCLKDAVDLLVFISIKCLFYYDIKFSTQMPTNFLNCLFCILYVYFFTKSNIVSFFLMKPITIKNLSSIYLSVAMYKIIPEVYS